MIFKHLQGKVGRYYSKYVKYNSLIFIYFANVLSLWNTGNKIKRYDYPQDCLSLSQILIEETILNRLQQIISHIEGLSDSANKLIICPH